MPTILIATEKVRNLLLIENVKSTFPDIEVVHIREKESLAIERVSPYNSNYIFFPHWSHIIPHEIYSKYECAVFHMTDLPYGRGGSPLQSLIVRGHKETMLSALRVNEGLDTGDIYIKRPLSLDGTAEQIYGRASNLIEKMMIEIIKNNPTPIPQVGAPTVFKRRNPEESNLQELENISQIYDYIRMLDAKGYQHPRSPEALETVAKTRGIQVGRRYAEAFQIIRTIL